jgi:ankyrin repeat protein
MTAGEGPATRACVDGDLDQLNALLNGLSEPLDELSTIDLHTALNIAVEKDDILAVDSLLKYATPTKYNLCDAIKNRSHYTVELLLQNGCNINEEIRSNCPPPLSYDLPSFLPSLTFALEY